MAGGAGLRRLWEAEAERSVPLPATHFLGAAVTLARESRFLAGSRRSTWPEIPPLPLRRGASFRCVLVVPEALCSVGYITIFSLMYSEMSVVSVFMTFFDHVDVLWLVCCEVR